MPLWIRALVSLVLLPGTVAGWLPWIVAGRPPLLSSTRPPSQVLGVPLFLLGWGIILWCSLDFNRRGRGTLAPYDPPRALVTHGLYDVMRNPMYVGVLTAVIGEAVWFWSSLILVYAAILAIGFHLRVLLYEEPKLQELFGESFASYRARVPRWIPGTGRLFYLNNSGHRQ